MSMIKSDDFSITLAPYLQRCRLNVTAEFFASLLLEGGLMHLSRGAPFTVVPSSRSGLTCCRQRAEWVATTLHLTNPSRKWEEQFCDTGDTYRKTETLGDIFIEH